MKRSGILAYIIWLPAVVLLARYDLRTDDAGVEVFFLLLITFTLGCLHPCRAWQWALLVGPVVPLTELAFGNPDFGRNPWRDALVLLAVLVTLGLGGSYLGAVLRRSVSH